MAKQIIKAKQKTQRGTTVEVPDFATDRYASLKLIPWWQHHKISAARIMVVGAGAIGNEVLKNLALLGIGHIYIVDMDTIEASNLSRSVLFRPGDSGKFKATTAAQRLAEINPEIAISYLNGNVITDIGLGAFNSMDLVLSCVDNMEARLFINESCWKVTKPWINGGIEAMQGVVDVFVPPDSACYECTMTDQDYAEMNRRHPCGLPPEQISEGKIPTTPTIASIVSAVMVQEAMKLIHGKDVQSGSGWLFFGLTNQAMKVEYPVSPDCPAHQHMGEPILTLDKSVAAITLRQLKTEFKRILGGDADIDLGFDLVLNASCVCGERRELLKRKELLIREDVICPGCGEVMATEVVSSLAKRRRKLANKTLADLGFPPAAIITAAFNGNKASIELTGDAPWVINYN